MKKPDRTQQCNIFLIFPSLVYVRNVDIKHRFNFKVQDFNMFRMILRYVFKFYALFNVYQCTLLSIYLFRIFRKFNFYVIYEFSIAWLILSFKKSFSQYFPKQILCVLHSISIMATIFLNSITFLRILHNLLLIYNIFLFLYS